MKALVGAFNQEKALVGAFSVIVQPVVEPMKHYTALVSTQGGVGGGEAGGGVGGAVGRGGRHQPGVHRVLRGQGILQRRQEKSRNLCDLQQNPPTE